MKTYRQVNDTKVSYSKGQPPALLTVRLTRVAEAARLVVREDGISGLLGRGLKTRILSNGLQGLLFSILWKILLDLLVDKMSRGREN